MATITTRANGSKSIRFTDPKGERQTITLGVKPRHKPEAVKRHVEELLTALTVGQLPGRQTAVWLSELDDKMHAKLARVGLVTPRSETTLTGWLDQYLEERKGELKPEGYRKLAQTRAKLLSYFGDGVALRSLTPQDASAWREGLKASGLSEATVKTHSGNVKTIFTEAVRRTLIDANPFEALKSGPTPSKYTRYVTPEVIGRVIGACPSREWALLFGLARYAGLRVPSETHRLTWADVNWADAKLTVHAPKTEGFTGHERRIVPIEPRLMALLQDRFEQCEEGQTHLVTIRGQGCISRYVDMILTAAGVEPWRRLWQTLRSSCEREWALRYPQYAVSKWIGHSIEVSGRHYTDGVPDELFARAAGYDAGGMHQKVHQQGQDWPRIAPQDTPDAVTADSANAGPCGNLLECTTNQTTKRIWRRGESNPRPVTFRAGRLRA